MVQLNDDVIRYIMEFHRENHLPFDKQELSSHFENSKVRYHYDYKDSSFYSYINGDNMDDVQVIEIMSNNPNYNLPSRKKFDRETSSHIRFELYERLCSSNSNSYCGNFVFVEAPHE